MALDAGIFQNIKPVEFDTYGDQQKRAATLSQMAVQNRRGEQEAAAADREAGMQKLNIIGNALESLSGLDPAARAQAYPQVRNQLVQSGVLKPEEVPEQHNEETYQAALRQYQHGMEYAKQQHLAAQTGLYGAEAQKNRAEAAKSLAESKNPKKNLSPGELKADEEFGKEVADYYYGGGKSTVETNISKLQGAIDQLKANPKLTGGTSTRIPGLSSDMAQDTINPEMAKVRDDIRGAVQGTLRATLGAQFTEKEGAAIFNRAFNPRLSAEENARRAQDVLSDLVRKAQQKDASMAHFKAQGTLKGFTPSGTAIASTGSAMQQQPAGGGLMNDAQAGVVSKGQATSQDMEAIHWAQKNKSDPRAQKILAMHGVK